MVKIEVKPVFWHTMNGFASFGYKDFVVALGYKGDVNSLSPIEALNKLFEWQRKYTR